jgi:hypothetical protein
MPRKAKIPSVDTPALVPHELRMTPVSDLKTHPKNARRHADGAIDDSIASNGVYKPLVASRATGFILAGNGTFERAKAAGLKELPVYWLDGLSPTAELKIIAADNRTADLSPGYSETMLAELLQEVELETGGFEGTGFTKASLDDLLEMAVGDVMQTARGKLANGTSEGLPRVEREDVLAGLDLVFRDALRGEPVEDRRVVAHRLAVDGAPEGFGLLVAALFCHDL